MAGPLAGLRIIEMAGIGPGPLCGMMLADHGAEVIRIDRPGVRSPAYATMLRSRTVVTLDLKQPGNLEKLKRLIKSADAIFEGFRPGTMERLGLGPEVLRADHSRLVYARMSGWGQSGPYAPVAGHDINYIAMTGALAAIGPTERPMPPLALVGDLGGGGALLAFSLTAALLKAQKTGEGDIIDCAMYDGVNQLMTAFYELQAAGHWSATRGKNVLDGGAHFYSTYRTADGKFVSVGAIEPEFYQLLLRKLGIANDPAFAAQNHQQGWDGLKQRLEQIFAQRSQAEWCALLEYTDVCFAPVLDMSEAPSHPHAVARKAFIEVAGVLQPVPAPRYSHSTLAAPTQSRSVDLESLLSGSGAAE